MLSSFLALVAIGHAAPAAKVALVDGATRATVAIPARPSAAEKLAAAELASYIERISGAPLAVTETDTPPAGPAIVLARRPAAELGTEGYSISIRDGRVLVTGARERSVLYGAYDLLERLGCRWLTPKFDFYGAEAEIVPKKSTVVLALENDVVEKPHLKLRKLYVEEGHTHDLANLGQLIEWMSKSRFNTLVIPTDYQGKGRVKWDNWREALTPRLQQHDIDIEVGGHGYQNFLNAEMEEGKLFKQHPEWFGMAEGKRVKVHGRVFCTSNPEAVDFVTQNVIRYLAPRPEITIFDFWPPDAARWCECDACTKLGPPEDRQARLVAHVIAAARAQGVKARFECIAYAKAIEPPRNPPMDPSVLIDFCPIGQNFDAQISDPSGEDNARYVAQFQAWRSAFAGDISIYSYYRKYGWRSLPVLIPHYMQRDLQWYERAGAQGISCYSEPGDWRTYELNYYTLARLGWHPDANVDAIVGEFATCRFGAQAAPARQLYQAMEDTVRRGANIPSTSLKSSAELAGYIERLETAKREFARAAGAKPAPAAAALVASVDYALRDLALQKMRADGRDVAAIEKQAAELVAFYQSHRGEGVFLTRAEGGRMAETYLPRPPAKKKK